MFFVVFLKTLPLLLTIAFGYLAGALRLFPQPNEAIDALNRYALYFGFPLLIFHGFCKPSLQLSAHPGFYLFHLLLAASILGVIALFGKLSETLRPVRGNFVLGTLFGNVAYLGLPLTTLLLGPRYVGTIALSVSLQVMLAMLLGPLCILWWQRQDSASSSSIRPVLRKLLQQPLLWAPIFGFMARLLPTQTLQQIGQPLGFFADSAAPVALFLLGLHIQTHQKALQKISFSVWGLLLSKLLLVPLLVVVLGFFFSWMRWLKADEWRVLLILSMMPTAITTFSIARDLRQEEMLMAQTILISTLLALLLIPLLSPWLLLLPQVAL